MNFIHFPQIYGRFVIVYTLKPLEEDLMKIRCIPYSNTDSESLRYKISQKIIRKVLMKSISQNICKFIEVPREKSKPSSGT